MPDSLRHPALAQSRAVLMTPAYALLWALALSLTWLIPNHFRPWTGFHADAWLAGVTLIGALSVIWRVRGCVSWTGLPCLTLALTLLPWLQYGCGLLPFAGQAWISSLYLSGLLLALLVGSRWERAHPGQLGQLLLLAVGLAGLASVGLQLYTWLGLNSGELTEIWSMGLIGDRPYANLGQPNNLATLLMWGLLAVFWAYLRGVFGPVCTVLTAMFLLLGLALTQSRTGLVAFTAVQVAIWYWRRLWPSRALPWISAGLYLFYWAFPVLLRWIYTGLLLGSDISLLRLPQQGEQRLSAWRLFLQASWERPWAGYGWSDVRSAQVDVARQFPSLGITFAQSHNLFLDLVLWTGWPIGLLLSGLLLRWLYRRWRAIRAPDEALLFMLLGVIGIHAMLELPLHYAYFLIPTGLIAGILDARLGARVLWHAPRGSMAALWLGVALTLGLVARDYLRVEQDYTALRFSRAHIGKPLLASEFAPDVLLLTQLSEFLQTGSIDARAGMTTAELDRLQTVAKIYPSHDTIDRLARALALNDRPQEAGTWLQIGCRVMPPADCRDLQKAWRQDAGSDRRLAAVAWPG